MNNPIAVPGTVVPSGSQISPGGAQGLQGLQGPLGNRYYGTDTTNSQNYVVMVATDFGLVAGVVVWVLPTLACVAAPTLNVNNKGAIPLVTRANVALSAGSVQANTMFGAVYDGSSFRVI